MNTPPLLVGATVLFWGWETSLLLPAAFVALVLELPRVLRGRLELAPGDFNRVSDLCTLLFAGSIVYLFSTPGALRTIGGPRALTVLFQRLPLFVALLVACQAYSTAGRVPASAFFWALRRKAARGGGAPGSVDLGYPYVALCVLSASAANVRTPVFYVGLCALGAWALWVGRSRRFLPVWWGLLLGVAVALGWSGQLALHRAQQRLEQIVLEYISNIIRRRDADPFRSNTAIGQLGELKLSDRIVLRVEPGPESRPPILLREASYNVYNTSAWFAVDAAFTPVPAEADGATWKFGSGHPPGGTIGVAAYLNRGRGVLPLPNGVWEIDKLAVVNVGRNPLGTVEVDEGLGLVNYRARFGADPVLDARPGGADLVVPIREVPALAQIAAELDLAAQTPAERVGAVARFFAAKFRYSIYQRARPLGAAPLEDFLLRSRSGHCEYFATATVLLLRSAGVPARYATGYSVQEWSALERRWVVRARHGHAWALAWVDGAWHDLDTTPPVWVSEEAATVSWWQPVADVWAWGEFLVARWRFGESGGGAFQFGWLLVPLGLLLAWRLYSRRRVGALAGGAAVATRRAPRPGEDSEFYLIEQELARTGLGRWPAEPASAWIRRLREAGTPPVVAEALAAILTLHYRYRFDPDGLRPGERVALRARAEAWLAERVVAARE